MISYRNDAARRALPVTQEQLDDVVNEAVRRVMALLAEKPKQKPLLVAPRIARVMDAACEACGITREEMLGTRRSRRVAQPRQLAMLVAYEVATHASVPQISHAFCRDHTTVLHAVHAMRERMQTEPELARLYHEIRAKVTAEEGA